MAQPTVFAIAGVSISASGGAAGNTLFMLEQQLQAASTAGTLHTYTPPSVAGAGTPANPITFPTPSASGGLQVLVIPAGDTGVISVPAGYGDIVYSGHGTVHANSGNVIVLGDLFFNGGAGSVVAGGTGGKVSDSTSGALLSVLSGNYTVNSTGAGQTVQIGNKAKFNLDVTGSGTTVQLGNAGDTTPAQQRGSDFVTIAGANDSITLFPAENALFNVTAGASNTSFMLTGAAATETDVVTFVLDSATTINGGNGNLVVFDQAGALTYNGAGNLNTIFLLDSVGGGHLTTGAHTFYSNVAGVGPTSIIGTAGGNDTVFAFSAVNVNDSAATSTLFVGSANAGADTVAAGATADIYGGSGGGTYTIGSSKFFFGGASGSGSGATATVHDTVVQDGTSAQGILFSNSNESLTLTSLAGGGTAQGDILFAAGNNTTVDATNSAGNNILLADNASSGTGSPPSAITGASTLIGSNAGHDTFVMFVDNTTEAAHTITIQNIQASDTFVVSNLGGAGAFLSADTAAITAFNAGSSGNSFTLQDGTTVTFVGTHPNVVMN